LIRIPYVPRSEFGPEISYPTEFLWVSLPAAGKSSGITIVVHSQSLRFITHCHVIASIQLAMPSKTQACSRLIAEIAG
jgi:hypothetical protein